MLPSADQESRSRKRPGGIEYLTTDHLSTAPKEGRVLMVKADPDAKFGARVILKLAIDGRILFWGVSIKKNPNYKLLTAQFGLDENAWIDKRILLGLEQDEFTGNYFARVTFPEKQESPRKR